MATKPFRSAIPITVGVDWNTTLSLPLCWTVQWTTATGITPSVQPHPGRMDSPLGQIQRTRLSSMLVLNCRWMRKIGSWYFGKQWVGEMDGGKKANGRAIRIIHGRTTFPFWTNWRNTDKPTANSPSRCAGPIQVQGTSILGGSSRTPLPERRAELMATGKSKLPIVIITGVAWNIIAARNPYWTVQSITVTGTTPSDLPKSGKGEYPPGLRPSTWLNYMFIKKNQNQKRKIQKPKKNNSGGGILVMAVVKLLIIG